MHLENIPVTALLSNVARMSTFLPSIANLKLAEKKNVPFARNSQLNLVPSLAVSIRLHLHSALN